MGGNKGLSTPTACTARTLYTERERVEILFDLLRLMYVQQFYFTTYKYPCVCRDECFSPKNCASVMFKKHFFFCEFFTDGVREQAAPRACWLLYNS